MRLNVIFTLNPNKFDFKVNSVQVLDLVSLKKPKIFKIMILLN